jgi:hypothetical protein
MSTPTYAGPYQFGPGSLLIGAIGTEVDFSCLVNNATLTTSVSTSDPTTKLCGTQFPGLSTFTAELAGNIDLDVATDSGLFQLSSEHAGEIQAFQFMPSTAGALEARGSIVIMPLPFGAANYGDDLAGDFTWATIGNIDYYRDGALVWTQNMAPRTGQLPPAAPVAATGATAGTPGAFTPAGCAIPANLAALTAANPPVAASPSAAWATGESVNLGTGSAHWDGAAWAAGVAA